MRRPEAAAVACGTSVPSKIPLISDSLKLTSLCVRDSNFAKVCLRRSLDRSIRFSRYSRAGRRPWPRRCAGNNYTHSEPPPGRESRASQFLHNYHSSTLQRKHSRDALPINTDHVFRAHVGWQIRETGLEVTVGTPIKAANSCGTISKAPMKKAPTGVGAQEGAVYE